MQHTEPCFNRSYFNTILILLVVFGELIDPEILKDVSQNMTTEKNEHAELSLFNILELGVGGLFEV